MNISNQKNNISSARTSDKKHTAKTTSSRTNEKSFSTEKKSPAVGTSLFNKI